jgi:hypothetical protein
LVAWSASAAGAGAGIYCPDCTRYDLVAEVALADAEACVLVALETRLLAEPFPVSADDAPPL